MAADAAESFSAACSAADRIRGLFADAGIEAMYEEKLAAEVQLLHDFRDEVSGEISAWRCLRKSPLLHCKAQGGQGTFPRHTARSRMKSEPSEMLTRTSSTGGTANT